MHVAAETREATIFWGDIAPSQHVAQFYADDTMLLDTLTGFVGGGLTAGESAIVIATPEHFRALKQRLQSANVDLTRAMFEDRYIALDADVALTSFMVDDWPDEQLFSSFVTGLLHRASAHNRRVRVFGEMVALLWARGLEAATVHLEDLWNQFCKDDSFSLFCAYPKAGFTEDSSRSLDAICIAHSTVFHGRVI
jgi:hypothetical protein